MDAAAERESRDFQAEAETGEEVGDWRPREL